MVYVATFPPNSLASHWVPKNNLQQQEGNKKNQKTNKSKGKTWIEDGSYPTEKTGFKNVLDFWCTTNGSMLNDGHVISDWYGVRGVTSARERVIIKELFLW